MERECEHVTDTRSVECESCDVRAKPKNSFPSDTRSTKTSLPNGTHSTDISPPSDTFSTRLQYTSVDRTSLASLRQFNSLLFPITYPESFYRSIIHTIGVSAFLVYWNETCIGSYSTRLESQTRWLSLVAGHVSDNFAPETLSGALYRVTSHSHALPCRRITSHVLHYDAGRTGCPSPIWTRKSHPDAHH